MIHVAIHLNCNMPGMQQTSFLALNCPYALLFDMHGRCSQQYVFWVYTFDVDMESEFSRMFELLH